MHAHTKPAYPAAPQPTTAAQSRDRRRWLVPAGLGIILLLGAAFRFYQLGAAGYGNQYYAATVKSMLTSWSNFFYAAYEPAGSVSVDKPPLGFWLQAISAAIFGLNGFALALPQALAGTLSLPLLYHLVQRHFGAAAGLLAAFVLAITPVTIATERNNTIDGTLVFALLLAAWFFLKATASGRRRWLFLGAFMVGVGFNIKMLQAFLPLPAFFALYFLGAPGRWWHKGVHLVAAGGLVLVVSLAWPLAVDLTPPANRPFVGSSQNNTVMELIIGHNGLARLLPGGRQTAATSAGVADDATAPLAADGPTDQRRAGDGPAGGNPINREVGEPGLDRLFTEPLVTEASWLFPLAFLGLIAGAGAARPRWPLAPRHQALVLWGGWFGVQLLFFSFANLFHAYYLIMFGPPLAALVAMAAWGLARRYRRQPALGWGAWLGAAVITLGFQRFILGQYPDLNRWLLPAAGLLAGVALAGGVAGLVGRRRWLARASLAGLLFALCLAPLAWSALTTLNGNADVNLPRSGPAENDLPAPANSGSLNQTQTAILDYVAPRSQEMTYLLATPSARTASPFILVTDRAVLTFGGFSGGDNVIDADGLATLVAGGELRYVLDDGSLRGQKVEVYQWLVANCATVNLGLNPTPVVPGAGPGGPGGGALTLHDCS